ncbi:hypothetical protein DPMN_032349 [Dreissena polymorpha]|uniref:Uncharacterized protein n=1 Tax=Dreissena polymorpha TaxID=45954 RepID=A0A9D4RIU7_DREPO|nr:hypothetical protein DPMN_032349 [Dreissena polymorpha]
MKRKKTTTAICFKVKKFVVEELSTKKKKLIHAEALHETAHGVGKGFSTSVGFRGVLNRHCSASGPHVARTWPTRGGGKESPTWFRHLVVGEPNVVGYGLETTNALPRLGCL